MQESVKQEEIPNEDSLYCYIHQANIHPKTGNPRAAAFQNTPKEGDNLSSDWSKYTTPEETKARVGKQYKFGSKEFKNPNLFGVVSFQVGTLRSHDFSQEVRHDPILNDPEIEGQPNNRAHAIIIGEKDEEIRLKMVAECDWLILPLND
jgi:hypothetical protein